MTNKEQKPSVRDLVLCVASVIASQTTLTPPKGLSTNYDPAEVRALVRRASQIADAVMAEMSKGAAI